MKAVVLVGGEGTRLRPLTETIPKPLIPLIDRPFLDHVLDHLDAHGVDEVLLSSPYLGERFTDFLRARTSSPGVTWITEDAPLGTGGAIAHATRSLDDTFFVLNGDILTDLDLGALLAFHREREARATITVSEVQDARPYGLVSMDGAGRISEFREKPIDSTPGIVNAGTYVLEPSALAGVPPDRLVSIEREVFPSLIDAGAQVFGFRSTAYWIDLGTPEKYLRATFDALDGRVGGIDVPAPYVHPSARVSLRARLGRWVVIQQGVEVADETEIEDSVVLAGASIGPGVRLRDSIVGPEAVIGGGAKVSGAVLAEGSAVAEGAEAEGARISAGHTLGA